MAGRAGSGNPRRAAVEALLHVHREGGYSHIVWENALETDHLTAADRALASRIFWGVIERRLTLDYLMDCYSRVPVKKQSLNLVVTAAHPRSPPAPTAPPL